MCLGEEGGLTLDSAEAKHDPVSERGTDPGAYWEVAYRCNKRNGQELGGYLACTLREEWVGGYWEESGQWWSVRERERERRIYIII